jgi:hypothetical protein
MSSGNHLDTAFAVNSSTAKLKPSLKGEAENKASLQMRLAISVLAGRPARTRTGIRGLSPLIPAQKELVQSYGVASELGYGGFLPSGRAYARVLSSQDPLQVDDAEKPKMIAPALQQALLSFDAKGRIWSASRGIPKGCPQEGWHQYYGQTTTIVKPR